MTKEQLKRKQKHSANLKKIARLDEERSKIYTEIRKLQDTICALGEREHDLQFKMDVLDDENVNLEIKGWPRFSK